MKPYWVIITKHVGWSTINNYYNLNYYIFQQNNHSGKFGNRQSDYRKKHNTKIVLDLGIAIHIISILLAYFEAIFTNFIYKVLTKEVTNYRIKHRIFNV